MLFYIFTIYIMWMWDFIIFSFVFNILKATIFSITYIILFILAIFVWYLFYKKYLNKVWAKDKPSTLRIFIEIIVSNCIAWFVHFLPLLVFTYIALKYSFWFLQIFSSYLALIIMAIAYYFTLKLFLYKHELLTDNNVKKIASSTTVWTFWVFILLLLIIWFILPFIWTDNLYNNVNSKMEENKTEENKIEANKEDAEYTLENKGWNNTLILDWKIISKWEKITIYKNGDYSYKDNNFNIIQNKYVFSLEKISLDVGIDFLH